MTTMTFQDRSQNEYEIVCYHCSSIQNYALKDVNNFPKRPKKNCSNCKKTIYLTIGIEENKIVVKPIKDPIIEELTTRLNHLKKDKVYTNIPSKESFHEVLVNHALELILKYPELPLFIYSKLYERISKEYVLLGSLSLNEMEAKGLDHDTEFNKLTYSFYDMYMDLFEAINKGKYDQEIEAYMKDIFQSYGTTYCKENLNLPFDKAKIEEVFYWSEEEAKEYIDKLINIVHPKDALEFNWSEEKLRKINEWTLNHAKLMVEEGSYLDDYSNVVKEVSEAISDTIDKILHVLELYEEPLTYDYIRIILLIHLMFDYRPFNVFDERPNEYIRADLLKLYVEMKRKRVSLGYIPCGVDYQDEITCIYDIYREYDSRWFGMNEPEKFLQYESDPSKDDD